MNSIRLIIYCFLYYTLYGCAPNLSISQIDQKINKNYTALFEGDVNYLLKNTPKKYLKEYGEDGFREELTKIYKNRNNQFKK